MTETEKPPLPSTMMPANIAQGIAKDAQEHLGGLDVIGIGPIFADEYAGDVYLQLIPCCPIARATTLRRTSSPLPTCQTRCRRKSIGRR
jgi:hypothetical protein